MGIIYLIKTYKLQMEIPSAADFQCSMDGYVELTLEAYNVALFGLALLKETYAALLPSKLGKSVNYAWKGVIGAGGWVGYIMAAAYYFGLEFGYADALCTASGYVYVGIGVFYTLLEFAE